MALATKRMGILANGFQRRARGDLEITTDQLRWLLVAGQI